MKILTKILLSGVLGLSALTSCEENKNIELAKGKLKNTDTEIRIIRNVYRANPDNYSIEIYDSNGLINAKFEYKGLPKGFIHCEREKIDLDYNRTVTEKEDTNNK